MAEGAAGTDATICRIADYARGLRFADLPSEAVHSCKRRIADTLACGIAAFDAEPSRIARALALRAELADGARVLGTARRAPSPKPRGGVRQAGAIPCGPPAMRGGRGAR